ncbi:hypothetical protein ACS0TY_017199 [Phlomoides rotata]
MVSKGRILLTGGCGVHRYSHRPTASEIGLYDNLDNVVKEAVHTLRQLIGTKLSGDLNFHLGDIMNVEDLEKLFFSEQEDIMNVEDMEILFSQSK